jgi:hypothetical protein
MIDAVATVIPFTGHGSESEGLVVYTAGICGYSIRTDV